LEQDGGAIAKLEPYDHPHSTDSDIHPPCLARIAFEYDSQRSNRLNWEFVSSAFASLSHSPIHANPTRRHPQ